VIGYQDQALRIAKEIGDKEGEGNCLCNLGSAYYNLGDYQKAIAFYEQGLAILRPMLGDEHPM